MYPGGRAPKANAEDIEKSRAEFRKAMDEFGVADLDETHPRRNKRKFKAAYFDKHSGGFYVMQKGHEYQEDEITVAKVLALHGYQVRMQPEGDGSGGVSLKLSDNGFPTYPDGLIGRIYYEQYTPKGFKAGNQSKAIKDGLIHVNDKGAPIAVIFDKSYQTPNKIHRNDISRGIARYKGQQTRRLKTQFQQILIITKLPRQKRLVVYEWHL